MDCGQEVKVSPEEMERLRLEREALAAAFEAKEAKRERSEIALRFAVAAYGGYWSNVEITSEPETIVDASFRMADAFIEARDALRAAISALGGAS